VKRKFPRSRGRMFPLPIRFDGVNVDPIAIIGALVLTLLAVLLTGPGMWSEKWGWGWLKGRRTPKDGDTADRERSDPQRR
jgi:hypothetical protein